MCPATSPLQRVPQLPGPLQLIGWPLVPRVSLFLSKMRTLAQSPAAGSLRCREDERAIGTRATELLNLLKMPSVAQFVLTPSVEVAAPRYHRDTNTALPLALRTVSRLVEKEAGLLPG